ncbi:MAG TPA: glycosyltransferase, partial [Rhizomicrobium sp.]
LVLADSDITVPPDWLSSAMASLDEPGVGAVSCFYAGAGRHGWSQLGAMGINYQFLPNAVLGAATGLAHPCFGSTIALRRRTLEEIGGFPAFRDRLADDFEIGRAVRRRGYRLAYPSILVSHRCAEQSFRELWAHELRWARTIRIVDPLGHWGSMLTHPLPWSLMAAALLGFSSAGLACVATVVAARLFLKARMDHIAGSAAGPAWLLPVRDLLSFAVFVASLFGGTVEWKARRLSVGRRGAIS